MKKRTVYVAIFLTASLVAAAIYALAQPRTDIVRATVDIPVLTQVTGDMVEVVRVAPMDAPPGAAHSLDEVVGRYAAVPILVGGDVSTRALEVTPGSQAFGFGAPLAPGQVAFALPVDPSQAVGGALAPGAKVDVIAVPNALRNGLAASPVPSAVQMGSGLTVLSIRTADGHQLVDPSGSGANEFVVPKIGSVVVAVPAEEAADYASAALTSTFYLLLERADAPPLGLSRAPAWRASSDHGAK